MAINYTTLTQKTGKIIGRSNSYASLASTTLPADLDAIVTQYGTAATAFGTAQGPIEGINQDYVGFQNNVVAWPSTLLSYINKTLLDYDTVVSQLPYLSNPSIDDLKVALIQDMLDNSQTVKGNTVTIGTVTAGATNIGNGTALVDKVLDGVSAPVNGGISTIRYNTVNSEMCVPSETMTLICTSDSSTSGGTEGSESWSWEGGQKFGTFDYHSEGSGGGPSLTTANGSSSILTNFGLTSFSSNTPTGWTIDAGTAGTNIFEETTAANQFRGTSCLRFTGDGTTTNFQISQAISASVMKARQRHLITLRMKRDGSAPGTVNISINFTGTGYTAASSEKIAIAAGSLAGSWTLYSFYINCPVPMPTDWKFVINLSGLLNSGANIYMSSGSATTATYHGGVNCAVLAGSTPWALGDKLTFTLSNTTTGKFQNYFRRALLFQAPSNLVGAETIDDSRAGP